MRTLLLLILLSFSLSDLVALDTSDHNVEVHLKSPVYEDGVLTTDQGGVLESEEMRIQAEHITYVKKENPSQWHVEAFGNLIVHYQGKTFVGEKLQYDFITQEGSIENGTTQVGCWFIHCKKILLKNDHTYELRNTSLTTCESNRSLWQMHVKKGIIKDHDIISARNMQVRVLHVPIFWFPYFKAKLSTLQDIPAYYSFRTGGSQRQQFSLRYLAYSSQSLKAYLELDYWYAKVGTTGPSGSIQFDYKNQTYPLSFQANNFLAYDINARAHDGIPSPFNPFRQRYVGEAKAVIANKLSINVQYEKLSDSQILQTYFNRYYFLHTPRHTQIEMRMQENLWMSYLRSTVRINNFETVVQEFPVFYFNLHPLKLWKTPFITDFTFNVGFLDYVYGNNIDNQYRNYRSPRLEIKPKLYLPIQIKGLTLTPKAEYVGIGYGQSYLGHPIWNSLGILEAEAKYPLSRIYRSKLRHTIEPYSSYMFMTLPTTPFQNHFFFDSDDAYAKINQLKVGLRNYLYLKHNQKVWQPLEIDLYSYGFFNNTTIGSYIPKGYLEITQRLSNFFISMTSAYNFQHQEIDFINVRTAWTISEDLALSFLFMHRSIYDYKKANYQSFLLDVFRSQASLLSSPLSDRRDIVQTKLYWRAMQKVIFEFESRSGWRRINTPPFTEMWFNVTFLLPCNWRLTLSPQRTISPEPGSKNIWRYTMNLQLGGNPPKKMKGPYLFW